MDFIMKQREVFFNNLLILGLDKTSHEKKYRMTFDKDMFCIPNQKMFEVVTYFLFSKLNEVSSKQYVLTWPILDKSQHRQFQKSCFTHLSAIASESDVKFPRFVSSLLSTFSGDRFYELYLAFSSHVLQRTIIKKNSDSLIMMPTVTPQNSQDVAEFLRIAFLLSVEKFQEAQSFSLDHFKMLTNYSKNLFAQVEILKRKLTTNKSLKEKYTNILKMIYCEEETQTDSLEDTIVKAINYEKKVTKLWTTFEEFIVKESELWNRVCAQVEENQEIPCLDGSNLQIVTDNLKNICPELNKIDHTISEEKGKPLLHMYLKSFHVLLEYYLKTSVEQELLETKNLCRIKNISSLEESLNLIKSLNERLVNVLPNLSDSTQNLKESLPLKEFSDDLEEFLKICPTMKCCSTDFQNQTNISRTEMLSNMYFTGGPCDSSLLLEDYTKLLENVSKLSKADAVARATDEQSIFHKSNRFLILDMDQPCFLRNDENVPNDSALLGNNLEQNLPFELSVKEFDLRNKTVAQNMNPGAATSQTDQDLSIFSSCDDFEIDLDYRKPYKLRESWQLEESLNAMTLPDMPEFEQIE
ncbi:hypothetical protein JTE90_018515 [Oedothorax gibbosus]|uniref:HAUS augmin-like complex subunit 6 N-terminal domain-containing protein n=1 Tax=Oedothorax gibbosus TaxID=931172 RepID=A0AAV6UPK3_9ARAC|nr:hypothetical protein JTE90_018515 [Oedothorax gibbosus]